MNLKSLIWVVSFSVSVLLFLSSCGGGNNDDLKRYLEEVKARPGQQISSIPMVKTYTPYIYEGHAGRDPFRFSTSEGSEDGRSASGGGLRPDFGRSREYLERFELDTLEMVGTFSKDSSDWALVKDPDGVIHRVSSGQFVGSNNGRVVALDQSQLDITELISDESGGWLVRPASISLNSTLKGVSQQLAAASASTQLAAASASMQLNDLVEDVSDVSMDEPRHLDLANKGSDPSDPSDLHSSIDYGSNWEVVHNLEFDGNLAEKSELVILSQNEETTLHYHIGQAQKEQIVRQVSQQLTGLIAEVSDVKIDVAFLCSVCAAHDNRQSTSRIIFNSSQQISNVINFQFTPVSSQERDNATPYLPANPAIALVLSREGITYDRVEIPVEVVDLSKDAEDSDLEGANSIELNSQITSSIDESSFSLRKLGGGSPDVTIEIYENPKSSGVEVKVIAHSDRVLEHATEIFASSAVTSQSPDDIDEPNIRRYKTAFKNFDDLERFQSKIYGRLSCLTVSPTTDEAILLRSALEDELQGLCAKYAGIGERWSKVALEETGGYLAKIGRDFYFRLFFDEAIKQGMQTLASFNVEDDPIKIAFKSPFPLPYQLLHAESGIDSREPAFFGFIFDISAPQNHLPPNLDFLRTKNLIDHSSVVFGGFKGDFRNNIASVPLIANMTKNHFSAIKGTLTKSTLDELKLNVYADDFVKDMVAKRKSLNLIWVFTHGDGRGWSASNYPGLRNSPRLIFGWDDKGTADVLTPLEISSALIDDLDFGITALTGRPFVALIACESGGNVISGTSGEELMSEFFILGARGVLTTDGEIHAGTATLFGSDLIKQLVNGVPASLAVLNTRKKMFRERRNLWVLLFNYQGAHGVYAGT